MFLNIFRDNLFSEITSCCECVCRCGCKPVVIENSVRSGGSGAGGPTGSKTASTASA